MKKYLGYGLITCLGIAFSLLFGPAYILKAAEETGKDAKEIKEASAPQEVVEVTAKKLNIRSGPGLNNPDIHTLGKGDKLVVLEDKEGWIKVQLPPNVPCWIHKKYLEIKGEETGLIRGDKVRVRNLPETGEDNVVGFVTEGMSVKLITNKGDWYKITPPETMTGWVNKKYTHYWGTYERYVEEANELARKNQEKASMKTTNEGRFQKAEELYLGEMNKTDLQQDFREALSLYHQVAESAPESEFGKKAKDRIQQIEPRERILQVYRAEIETGAKKKKDLDDKYNQRIISLLKPQQTQTIYDAEGWVDSVGKLYKRPASFKLTKGDEDLFFIKAPPTVNMDDYYKKYVGIVGKVIKIEGWNMKAIIVEKIDILNEK
ncbi:MAG: SH3 domain-containing protein [Candidatus Brocadiia bacterium]